MNERPDWGGPPWGRRSAGTSGRLNENFSFRVRRENAGTRGREVLATTRTSRARKRGTRRSFSPGKGRSRVEEGG